MKEITTVGLDLAKNVFQIHAVDAAGAVAIRRQVGRAGPDGGVAAVGLPPALAGRRCVPCHGGLQPVRQQTAALERFVVAGPVPGLPGRGGGGLLMQPSYHAGFMR
jgi:hypothetical protein